MKNIILVSCVFTLHFTAFKGLSHLQSSLHTEDGLGTVTQTILYAAFTVACLLLPKMTIHLLGHKWSIVVSIVLYMVWMAANGQVKEYHDEKLQLLLLYFVIVTKKKEKSKVLNVGKHTLYASFLVSKQTNSSRVSYHTITFMLLTGFDITHQRDDCRLLDNHVQ